MESGLPQPPEDIEDDLQVSLVELVDHVLNKGAVLAGELTIAIADIDLIYLGLNIVLASAETVRGSASRRELLPWPHWGTSAE